MQRGEGCGPGGSWRVVHAGLEVDPEKTVTVVTEEVQMKTAARYTW